MLLVARAAVELLDLGEAFEVSTRRLQELWNIVQSSISSFSLARTASRTSKR